MKLFLEFTFANKRKATGYFVSSPVELFDRLVSFRELAQLRAVEVRGVKGRRGCRRHLVGCHVDHPYVESWCWPVTFTAAQASKVPDPVTGDVPAEELASALWAVLAGLHEGGAGIDRSTREAPQHLKAAHARAKARTHPVTKVKLGPETSAYDKAHYHYRGVLLRDRGPGWAGARWAVQNVAGHSFALSLAGWEGWYSYASRGQALDAIDNYRTRHPEKNA